MSTGATHMDPKITQALELLHEVFGSDAQIGMDIHHCDDLAEAVELIGFAETKQLTASDGHVFRYYRHRSSNDTITVYSGDLDKAGQLETAAEIADLKRELEAAYAEDKPTHFPTWSKTYAENLLRHGEDEAVS